MGNIKSLNYEFTHKRRLKPKYVSEHPNNFMYNNVGLCDENNSRGYNVNFSGSAPEKSEAAAKTFMDKILKSGIFNRLVKFTGNHNVAAAALIALFLAGGLRPAITISLPGKKDTEDKIYAAGHSMASGLIGFGFSTLITTPIDSGIKYIFEDAKKIKKEDYDNLTKGELADYIVKNNVTAEDIAEKMASKTKSKEEILELLKDKKGRFFKSDKLAEFVKNNNIVIMPIRKLNGKFSLSIVSDKIDEINKLKHELFLENAKNVVPVKHPKWNNFVKFVKHKIFRLKEKPVNKPMSARAHDLAKQIRELTNHTEGINTSMHNISEWVIAIPRAMLTIALIPPILKYVFHVEKKSKTQQQTISQTPENNNNNTKPKIVRIVPKSMNEFLGGIK